MKKYSPRQKPVPVCHVLHAAWVQVAARCGHSDQTGGEGQQQTVTGPVQRQRQELTSLRRVLATSGDSETHKCEDGRQRVRSRQREVTVRFLALNQVVTGSKASSVGTSSQTDPCPNPYTNGHNISSVRVLHRHCTEPELCAGKK